MLYSLFIYQSSSGLMLWKKTFEKKMDSNKVELFSSFFSAIQSFVKEIISDTSSKGGGLNNLEMGNFLVNVNHISKLNIDIVAIADKWDQNHISKFIPKLVKLLYSHGELFQDWDGNKSRFSVLDLEIMVLITNEADDLFDSKAAGEMGAQITGLQKEQRERYEQEMNLFEKKLLKTSNLYKKIEIIDGINSIAEKLGNADKINWCTRQKRTFTSEIDSTKFKLGHFVARTKEAINKTVQRVGGSSLADLNYRDAYISLYSFSSKLKLLGKDQLSEKYKNMAKELIDKTKPEAIPSLIQDILKLPENPDAYLS